LAIRNNFYDGIDPLRIDSIPYRQCLTRGSIFFLTRSDLAPVQRLP
jgi:hypothetical protein